jgi:hypothetical protein
MDKIYALIETNECGACKAVELFSNREIAVNVLEAHYLYEKDDAERAGYSDTLEGYIEDMRAELEYGGILFRWQIIEADSRFVNKL